jgi:hypothetical protein
MAVVSAGTTLTYKEMLKLLEETEGLKEELFELGEDSVEFICDLEDEDNPLKFKINSSKYNLNAESTLQILNFAKMPKSVIDEYDIDIIATAVNWYYANKGGELKALVKDKTILAFTRPGTEIYSTVELIKEMVRALEGFDITEFHFDNVYHTLKETYFSLVVPHKSHDLDDGDILRAGIFFQNSLVGLKPLTMNGYISRDYHENGMISAETVEKWSRKQAKKSDDVIDDAEDHYDVYTWAFDTADTIMRAFSREAKQIEYLSKMEMGNHAGTLFGDIFKKNNIPVAVQKLVREEYVDQPGQTVYDLWNSITLTANRTEIEDAIATRKKVMEAAGKLAAHPQSCTTCHRLTSEDI